MHPAQRMIIAVDYRVEMCSGTVLRPREENGTFPFRFGSPHEVL